MVPLPQDLDVETRAPGKRHNVLAIAIDVAAQLGKYEVVALEHLQTQPREQPLLNDKKVSALTKLKLKLLRRTAAARHKPRDSLGLDDSRASALRHRARSDAFTVGATFPSIAGDPPSTTTPEELLAAPHATCYGIGLRSLIARRGGRARRVSVTATVAAEKGPQGIRLQSSHLAGIVDGLEATDESALPELAREPEERCTISITIRGAVAASSEVCPSP